MTRAGVAIALACAIGAVLGARSNQPRLWHGQALDGDTFIVSGEHVRLQGLDAPELPGHCRGWRAAHGTCARGDPWLSRRGLQAELDRGIFCSRHGEDIYGRTLATCTTIEGADLSQLLISEGLAQPYVYHGRR